MAELSEEARKREAEIFKLTMDIKTAKVKNTTSLRNKTDELAVVKTLMREKALESKNK